MEPGISLEPERSLEPWRKALKSGNKELPQHLQKWLAPKYDKVEEKRVMNLLKKGCTISYENMKEAEFKAVRKAVDHWNTRHSLKCKCISYQPRG